MSDREPLTDDELDRLECRVAQSWVTWFPSEVRLMIAEIRQLRAELKIARQTNRQLKRELVEIGHDSQPRDPYAPYLTDEERRELPIEEIRAAVRKVRDRRDSPSILAPGTFVACTSDAPRRATPGVPETRPDEDD